MRAIYRAVCADRQVVFLAPSVVLAAQHRISLVARMPDVRIEMLSSTLKARERTAIKKAVAEGAVDVLIGTSSVITTCCDNLGLLVVDEEQRFGVRQKEVDVMVQNAAPSTDVLLLSATPIPRSLYTATSGIHTVSRLTTPPPGRLAVQTSVCERNDELAVNAITEELARGGQVLYIVKDKKMVQTEVDVLDRRLPTAIIDFAYSGISDLELRIANFSCGKTNVLVATTVVECGIDIPKVNTIIIQDAVSVII